jgi:dienelactone hydrolase
MRAVVLLILGLWAGALAAAGSPPDQPLTTDPVPDSKFPAAVAELAFESQGDRLPGLLYLANGEGPHPTVILLHGLPGNEKNLDIAQAVRRAGFNAMFFHYRGAWGAEGNYRLTGLAEDVAAAVAFLRNNASRYRVDDEKLTLLGHSMGGFASLAAGSRDPGLACVGAMAPANLGLMAEGIRAGDPGSLEFLSYADSLFMLRNFDGEQMRKELLSSPSGTLDTRLYGPGLRRKSVFLVTGTEDSVLPPATMFNPVVAAYQRDEAIRLVHHSIPGDHSFSYSRLRLTDLVANWLLQDCK